MGFWSGLGNVLKKVALPAAGMAATMFTGGAAAPLTGMAAKLAAAGKIAGMAGGVAGSLVKGREAGRDKENTQAVTQDAMRLQAMRDFENAQMNRAELELKQKGDKRSSQAGSPSAARRGAGGRPTRARSAADSILRISSKPGIGITVKLSI